MKDKSTLLKYISGMEKKKKGGVIKKKADIAINFNDMLNQPIFEQTNIMDDGGYTRTEEDTIFTLDNIRLPKWVLHKIYLIEDYLVV